MPEITGREWSGRGVWTGSRATRVPIYSKTWPDRTRELARICVGARTGCVPHPWLHFRSCRLPILRQSLDRYKINSFFTQHIWNQLHIVQWQIKSYGNSSVIVHPRHCLFFWIYLNPRFELISLEWTGASFKNKKTLSSALPFKFPLDWHVYYKKVTHCILNWHFQRWEQLVLYGPSHSYSKVHRNKAPNVNSTEEILVLTIAAKPIISQIVS